MWIQFSQTNNVCACAQHNVGQLFQIIMPEGGVFLESLVMCMYMYGDLHILVSIVTCAIVCP